MADNAFVRIAKNAALQVYTDGEPVLKAGTSGFAVLLTAYSEMVSSVFFAVLLLFWGADMVSGMLRAFAMRRFSMIEFFSGFIKLGAAGVGISIAIGLDALGSEALDVTRDYTTTLALSAIAFAFGASATENLAYWFPGLAGKLAEILNRGNDAPDIGDGRLKLKDLDPETQEKIRAVLASEGGA